MEVSTEEENPSNIILELKEIYDSYDAKQIQLENQNREILENGNKLHKELEEIVKETEKMTEKKDFLVDESNIQKKTLFKISLEIKELKLKSMTSSKLSINNLVNSQEKKSRLGELKKEAENWKKAFNELLEEYKIVKGAKLEESYCLINKEKAIEILEKKERELIKLRSENKRNKIYLENYEKLETYSERNIKEIDKIIIISFLGKFKNDNEIQEIIFNNYEFISLQNKILKMKNFENVLEEFCEKKKIRGTILNDSKKMKLNDLEKEIKETKTNLEKQWKNFFSTDFKNMVTSIDNLKKEIQNLIIECPILNKEKIEILYLLEELDPFFLFFLKEDKTSKKLHEINEKIKKNVILSDSSLNITIKATKLIENYENIGKNKRKAKKICSYLKDLLDESKMLNYFKCLTNEEQNISILKIIPEFPSNFDKRHEYFNNALSQKKALLAENALDFKELSILEDFFIKKLIIQEFLQNSVKKETGEITSQITKIDEQSQSLEKEIGLITNYIDLETNSALFNNAIQLFLQAIDGNLKGINESKPEGNEEKEKKRKLKQIKSLLIDKIKNDIKKISKKSKKIRDQSLKQEEKKNQIKTFELDAKKLNDELEREIKKKIELEKEIQKKMEVFCEEQKN